MVNVIKQIDINDMHAYMINWLRVKWIQPPIHSAIKQLLFFNLDDNKLLTLFIYKTTSKAYTLQQWPPLHVYIELDYRSIANNQ